jgi:hypothetical protein
MVFEYYSSMAPNYVKKLPPELVSAIREHLVDAGFNRDWTRGVLQDSLLDFRWNGERLLINQLAPIFTYLSIFGTLWVPDEIEE